MYQDVSIVIIILLLIFSGNDTTNEGILMEIHS